MARISHLAIVSVWQVTLTQPGVGDAYARSRVTILMPRLISSTTAS
jgi:hypothetical protein